MQPKVVTTTKTQVDEVCKKFELTKLLLVSYTSLGIISTYTWLIDSGATCHVIGA
jgi:hypothetical protein